MQPSTKQEESEMKITTVGIDIAKSVFHAVYVKGNKARVVPDNPSAFPP
jgi:hypothetical protein